MVGLETVKIVDGLPKLNIISATSLFYLVAINLERSVEEVGVESKELCY
jgi:hypothetical protein